MKTEHVKAFASLLGRPVHQVSGEGWAQITCPLAPWTHASGKDSHPSFGIKIKDGGVSKAHCFSCMFTGTLQDLVIDLKSYGADLPFKALNAMLVDEEDSVGFVIAPPKYQSLV